MLRKLLVVVCAAAVTFTACGRQVTPDRTGSVSGLPSGFTQVKLTTKSALDFTNIRYVIAFNTSGNGAEPYANASLTNFQNYSFEIVVGGNGTVSQPEVVQFVRQPGTGGGTIPVAVNIPSTPQQLQFNPNSNSQNTQFTVTFDRRLFNGIQPTPPPGPNTNPNVWFANWFTTDSAGHPIDAPGLGGPQDVSFTFSYDITSALDQPWNAVALWPQVSPQSAQLLGGEILNNP